MLVARYRQDFPADIYIYTKVNLGPLKVPLSSTILLHTVGANPSTDVVLFEDTVSRVQMELWYARPTSDGKYLGIQTQSSEQEPTIVGLIDLQSPARAVHWISETKVSHYVFLGDNGKSLFFRSGQRADKLEISSFEIADVLAGKITKKNLVLQNRSMPIHQTIFATGRILVAYTDPNVQQSHHLVAYNEEGKLQSELPLPERGTVDGFRISPQSKTLYF